MTNEQHGRRGRLAAIAAAVLLVVAGVVALVVGLTGQQSPPQPPASAAQTTADASPAGEPTAAGSSTGGTELPAPTAGQTPDVVEGPMLPASEPVSLDIPAIEVSSDLTQLGLNPDGTVEVPPLASDSRAGWYRNSPTPGEAGPSVLLGHVDSAEYGPAIFFRLGDLRPGDVISVRRADGTVAEFTVDRVTSYPKASFPTLEVYGNVDRAELRLITCGGDFDPASRNYLDNIVVYASLSGSRAA